MGKRLASAGYVVVFLAGFAGGVLATHLVVRTGPDPVLFAEHDIPVVMTYSLGQEGAYQHSIGRWNILSALTEDNDSLILQYNDIYIASFHINNTGNPESIVVSHPLHESILLILEELNRSDTSGKLTLDILSADGRKLGFIIDENLDGQPNLRFEYDGPRLYVWLDEAWHRVTRVDPDMPGKQVTHTVKYQGRPHRIYMERFPYRLEPL